MDKKKQTSKKKAIQPEVEARKVTAVKAEAVEAVFPIGGSGASASDLRKQAEKIARIKAPDMPVSLRTLSPAAASKLLHEFRVHQIELEMSNEELRTAQEKLEESRAQYFELYDMAPVGYFSISKKGLILQANLTADNLLGLASGGLRARLFSSLILKEDRDIYYLHSQQLFDTGKPQSWEMRMVSNGSPFWARVEATLAQDGKRGKHICRAAISDVTAQKKTAGVLQESEAQYRLLADYHKRLNEISVSLIEATDTQDLFNRIAESFRLLTGAIASSFSVYNQELRDLKIVSLSIDRVSRDKVSSVFGPELFEMRMPVSADVKEQMLSQVIRRPKDLHELSFGAIPPDISAVVMEAVGCRQIVALAINYAEDLVGTCIAYLPENQQVVPDAALKTYSYISGVAVKRRRTEEALRESEAQYRLLAEHTTDTIFLLDMNLKMTYHSPSGEKLRGFTPQEIMEMPLQKTLTPESLKLASELFFEEIPKAEADSGYNPIRILDLEYSCKDGTTVWAESKFRIIRDDSGKAVAILGEGRDITDRRLVEEALRHSEERFQTLFENSPTSIWEEDFSELKAHFNTLQADGINDWRKYFNDHPEQVALYSAMIKVVDVNQTSVRFFGVNRKEDIPASLPAFFTPASMDVFKEELISLAEGKTLFECEIPIRTLSGGDKILFLSLLVVPGYEQSLSRVLVSFIDVTERKKAEEALRANEVKLDNALRSVQMGVWSLEIIENKRIFDDQTCHLLGLNPAKFGGTAEEFFSAIHPDDREKIRAALAQTIEKDVLYEPGYRVIWPDGSVHHICARGRLVLDDHGHPLRISGIIWDITDSKLAEEALRSKQIMLERTEGIAHVGSWEWDAVTDAVTWSDELYRIFQRDPQEGAPSFAEQPALYHPDDFALLLQAVEVAVADGTPYALELRAIRKDGKTRVCMARGVAEKALSGRVVRLVGSIQDITERKIAEVSLKESEEKYRMVVENAHEAIVIAVDGVNKFANRKITELTGYTREEITARPFIEFVHSDDRQMVATRYQQRLRGEDIPATYSFRIVDKLGYIKWVELSAASITWEGKTGTLNFVIDITDRKHLEEERQRVGKLESVGVLAGGIAHDFNNILTSILGNVSIAKMEVEPDSETYKSLEQAEKASQRARDLTKQLLTFSKGGSPVTKLASITELLRDTAGFALRGSNVKCNFSIPADLWHAEIDTGQVSQIIQNLVINAQQAMPTGGTIEISAENITLSNTQSLGRGLPLPAGNYIRIAVTDRGSGIASEHLDKVFDPFFTTKQKGSGLGLATSFSIARQHNGHLSVESQTGSGSTFFLYLPASLEIAGVEKAEKQKNKPAGQARILVMDDEQGIKEVAGRMLTMIGYKNVEFATDGAEVIKLYEEAMQAGKPISLVILDLTIPGGMGGKETIMKLLEIDPGVKAIVSSGYHEDIVMAKYKEHGFSGMVVKPYTIEQLAKALEDALK